MLQEVPPIQHPCWHSGVLRAGKHHRERPAVIGDAQACDTALVVCAEFAASQRLPMVSPPRIGCGQSCCMGPYRRLYLCCRLVGVRGSLLRPQCPCLVLAKTLTAGLLQSQFLGHDARVHCGPAAFWSTAWHQHSRLTETLRGSIPCPKLPGRDTDDQLQLLKEIMEAAPKAALCSVVPKAELPGTLSLSQLHQRQDGDQLPGLSVLSRTKSKSGIP